MERRLVVVHGEEGAGKSTVLRALLPRTPRAARIDAEDIGQTNPCPMDDEFPEDVSIREASGADYRYIGVDTSTLDVGATVDRITTAVPEVYSDVASTAGG